MTTIALLVLLVAVPTGIIGAVCMIRLGRDLDRESERGFTLPEGRSERAEKRGGQTVSTPSKEALESASALDNYRCATTRNYRAAINAARKEVQP